jgi:TIR domain
MIGQEIAFMADDDVTIFLSYAHNDDLATTAAEDELGFVSFLYQRLNVKLSDLGATRAKVWLDHRRVSDGDQFDDVIGDGLKKAEILVVVMSNNWMERPYCRKEFDAFMELRKAAGAANVLERMIVVGKNHVDRLKRPAELQGQEGFLFYARDDQNDVSAVTPFYARGKASNRFYDRLDDLATCLQGRVDRIAACATSATTSPPQQPIVAPNGRVVYLAKPASDMKEAYARLAFELQGKGFSVVPEVAADLPSDSSALGLVNDALAKAETSVHLVGEKPGFAPEGLDPILKLQLARAHDKAAATMARDPAGRVFRRIVWAPKILDAGAAAAGPATERDPLQTLGRFDAQIATDKIDGDILSKFVEFLFQYLAETAPRPAVKPASGNKLQVYLSYHGCDEDYAEAVAEALRDSPVKIRIPVPDTDADARRFNSDLLVKCDAVTLCWAQASEVWVRSEADKLTDWQGLGRKQQFAYRGLIAGPPPIPHKTTKAIGLLFQDGEFDKVVDLVAKGPPTRDLLADLAPDGAGSTS